MAKGEVRRASQRAGGLRSGDLSDGWPDHDHGITEEANVQRAVILEESIDARKLLPGVRLSSF